MQRIEIDDELYTGLAEKYGDVSAYFVRVAQADLNGNGPTVRFDPDEMVNRFGKFKNAMKGGSLEELLADRRLGAE